MIRSKAPEQLQSAVFQFISKRVAVFQEWSKRAVEDLLAQMSLPEADAQREAEVVSMETGGRMNLERSVDAPNNLPPRERKAGCKNFYWKGFTSC